MRKGSITRDWDAKDQYICTKPLSSAKFGKFKDQLNMYDKKEIKVGVKGGIKKATQILIRNSNKNIPYILMKCSTYPLTFHKW